MALTDKIIIKDLEVNAHIGVTLEEQARSQRLLVTVELERDLADQSKENRELLKLKIEMLRDQVEAERSRSRINFN